MCGKGSFLMGGGRRLGAVVLVVRLEGGEGGVGSLSRAREKAGAQSMVGCVFARKGGEGQLVVRVDAIAPCLGFFNRI